LNLPDRAAFGSSSAGQGDVIPVADFKIVATPRKELPMIALNVIRRWVGPALAASLWFGFAAAPGPALTAAEMAAIWGPAKPQADETSRTQPQQAQAPSDPASSTPRGPAAAAGRPK
jgi:hypothetical protein